MVDKCEVCGNEDDDCDCNLCYFCEKKEHKCTCGDFFMNAILVTCGTTKCILHIVTDARKEFKRICDLLEIEVKNDATSITWDTGGSLITVGCVQVNDCGFPLVCVGKICDVNIKFDEIPEITSTVQCERTAIRFIDVFINDDYNYIFLFRHNRWPSGSTCILLELEDGKWVDIELKKTEAAGSSTLKRKRLRDEEEDKKEDTDQINHVSKKARKADDIKITVERLTYFKQIEEDYKGLISDIGQFVSWFNPIDAAGDACDDRCDGEDEDGHACPLSNSVNQCIKCHSIFTGHNGEIMCRDINCVNGRGRICPNE